MADVQEFSIKLKDSLDLACRSFEAESSEGYGILGEQMEELETMAIAYLQDHEECKAIVKKLELGDPLTPGELETVKQFVVGDANYYLKFDDNFDRSKAELKRVLDEIRELLSKPMDLDEIMHLGVLCKEASSAAKPTAYYMEQKERVHRFEEATRGGLNVESAKILANILRRV
jgi:hypothetical protein